MISLIIQNICILKFWNIYINSWFCWRYFLALGFGIHQRVLNGRTAFGRRMVISILASFQKWVNFHPSLWLQTGEHGSGAHLVSLIAKPVGATTCLEYKFRRPKAFFSLTTWQFWPMKIFIQLWIRKPRFVFVVFSFYILPIIAMCLEQKKWAETNSMCHPD